MNPQQIKQAIDLGYKMAEAASSKSLEQYLNHVVIDSRPEPRLFRDCADPWQWSLARRVIPALENATQIKKGYKGPLNFLYLLPRGHDKSSLIGRLLNGVLAFSKVPITAVAAAADRDQAALITEAMEGEARLNKWVGKHLEFSNYSALSHKTHSRLDVIAADAPTASGLRCDIILFDEFCEWKKRDVFDKIYSGRDKREHCVVLIISNTGIRGSWQWDIKEAAEADPDNWYVYQAPGPIASWIDEAALERQKKFLTEAEYLIKVKNQWLDPSMSFGFVPKDAIQRCQNNSLARGVLPATVGDPDKWYVGSLDYGVVKDRTVLTILHMEKDGAIIIDKMDVWQGSKESPVTIAAIERWLDEHRTKFRFSKFIFDPWQLEGTYQRYQGLLPLEKFSYRGGAGNHEMAQALRTTIVNGNLLWPEAIGEVMFRGKRHTFADELNEVITVQMGYGFRISTLPNFHDDRVVAVGSAVKYLLENKIKKKLWMGDNGWF